MAKIVPKLRTSYNFSISEEEEEGLCKASLLRNCIVHNSAHADARLAELNGFKENEEFALSSEQVHGFGIMLRALVRRMCAEANANHNIGIEQ